MFEALVWKRLAFMWVRMIFWIDCPETTISFSHGTIIRTGITCKKIPFYMHDSACRWLMVENAKIFRSYVKHCWIFPIERNCRILIGLCKKVFINHPIMFLDRGNKRKVCASFFFLLFRTFMRVKKFYLKMSHSYNCYSISAL